MTSLMTIMAKTPRKSGVPTESFDAAALTFSASMAKRSTPGPFAAAPIVQTSWDGANAGDQLTAPIGTPIDTYFYPTLDLNQGTIVFWVTPEWDGNDGKLHMLWSSSAFQTRWSIYKAADNSLYFIMGDATGFTVTSASSSWTAGSTYCIVARWDGYNDISASARQSLSIDDSHIYSNPSVSLLNSSTSTMYIGCRPPGISDANQGNATIEGLTIYRRVLFDGTYGIDVGNGDELALIYNSGSGTDPTEITGSWDVVFALPTEPVKGAMTTGDKDAWSHPHSTSESNLTDSFMQTTYGSSAWSTKGTPSTAPADMATADKIFAAGGYDWVAAADADGIEQSLTGLTAESSWVIRCLAHVDDANPFRLRVYDDTNGAEIAQLTAGASSSRAAPGETIFAFQLPNTADGTGAADCTAITISIEGTAASQGVFAHQCELHENDFTNPSMASGSGDPWIPTGWTNSGLDAGDSEQELTIVHTGGSSLQANSGWASNEQLRPYRFLGQYNYWGTGVFMYGDGSTLMYYRNNAGLVSNSGSAFLNTSTPSAAWTHIKQVARMQNASGSAYIAPNAGGPTYFDDIYAVALDRITLTVTPATEANSAESGGIRIDGNDNVTQSISGLTTTRGLIRFIWIPRHDNSTFTTFQDSDTPCICTIYRSGIDYIRFQEYSLGRVRLVIYMNGALREASPSGSWVTVGSEHLVEIEYTAGATCTLTVDGVLRGTVVNLPAGGFGSAPTIIYWGRHSSDKGHMDAVYKNP